MYCYGPTRWYWNYQRKGSHRVRLHWEIREVQVFVPVQVFGCQPVAAAAVGGGAARAIAFLNARSGASARSSADMDMSTGCGGIGLSTSLFFGAYSRLADTLATTATTTAAQRLPGRCCPQTQPQLEPQPTSQPPRTRRFKITKTLSAYISNRAASGAGAEADASAGSQIEQKQPRQGQGKARQGNKLLPYGRRYGCTTRVP